MKKLLLILFAVILTVSPFMRGERFVGGDISLLPEYEKAGAVYKDISGNIIPDLLPWLKTQGMNAMRVRLFVNPSQYLKDHPSADKNACQDLEYITPICKRVVDNGMDLMLDFHYSDTWADPAKQWTPTDWQNLTDEQLYQKIYDYTKESLETLKAEGIEPTFIQPGNEISYGMLWGKEGDSEANLKKVFMNNSANWARFGKLLSQAIKACREVCPDAKIVIHTERVAQADVEKYFYDKMKELNVDYDIIGLSYYPYFHGKINVLNSSLTMLEANYPDKEIMIVETGYAYAWEVPGTDKQVDYPYSPAGQNQFASALVNTLESHKTVDGLFWWWLGVAQADVEKYFYDKMKELNVDYDIIGLSYYPYFHGKINVLNSSLTMLEANYPDKEIMIVETGYAYAWEVPGTDKQVDYPYSPAGQNQFASALVNTLESHKTVDGLFWWWLEYNAYSTNLSGWYNAPLFDSRDGKALPALTTICSFADSSAVNEISADTDAENEEWYNLSGVKVSAPSPASAPGIYLSRTRKVIIK